MADGGRLAHSGLAHSRTHGPGWLKKHFWLNLAIGACMVAATATGGVWLEYTIHRGKNPFPWTDTIILAGFLGASFGFYVWSQRLNKNKGTAYLVEFQSVSAIRRNAPARARLMRKYGLVQTLSYRIDFGSLPEIDVAVPVNQLNRAFADDQNADTNLTGYDVVPDMVAPVALAVGYAWTPPTSVRLREVSDGNPKKKPKDFKFDLDRLVRDEKKVATKLEEFEKLGLKPGVFIVENAEEGRKVTPLVHYCTSGKPDSNCLHCSNLDAKLICLRIILGSTQMTLDQVVNLPPFSPNTIKSFLVCGIWDEGNDKSQTRKVFRTVNVTNKRSAIKTNSAASLSLSPAQASIFAGEAIRQVMNTFPNASVLLSMLVPKTVSVAAGWYLANAHDNPQKMDPEFPWRRLIPLFFEFNNGGGTNRPTRVRTDQPPIDQTLQGFGVSWNGTQFSHTHASLSSFSEVA